MENPEPLATMDTRHTTKPNKAKYVNSSAPEWDVAFLITLDFVNKRKKK
jgi:hypothetical protein